MATSVKTDLTRFMTTADSLVHFEAITDAPGAPYPPVESVAITSIPCGKDCIVAVGDTKSILKSQYWIVNGTNPKRSLPGTLSSSNRPKIPGPFHGKIHRQSDSNARWKTIPLKFKNKWRTSFIVSRSQRSQGNNHLKTLFNVQSLAMGREQP